MAEKGYKDYLAVQVLTEGKPVTYRLLSRALKTNVNTAKRMLFEFHKKQNARKPGSVHATYLITGTPRRSNSVNNRSTNDTEMKSEESDDSDFANDSDDEDTPAPRGVRETHIVLVQEEELEETRAEFEEGAAIHVYSIERAPIEILGVLSMCNEEARKEDAKKDPLKRWSIYGSIRNKHIKRRTAKYALPKDATTSKATAKPVLKPATKATATIQPMQGMSEDEGDPDDEPEIKIDEEKNEAARKAREERAERLRKMMEDDDDEMTDAPAAIDAPPEATTTATVDEPAADEGEVTKEEFVWESFSEEEPVPKKAKPAPKPATTAKGKNAVKKGQGSIANFFKKAT
ncbi:dna polymerase subunit cdc27 protein [Pyrenophora tritici-repentis]|uniref:DNA polymerase delta subunit 3 n=1 Tax=Pyrenophora tritici-repentis TaxID=45151 RepID=A0A2W1EFA8_9PLEO|nr:dna polymerase subunit cdc27 [Pyrenophora tritici-repentis]KAF7442127.1 dna polymerase protein [Pyrenophora tritici-repentis]KAF7579512.1 putative dna polymerase subunit cdc27 protein [Pyrenophora tritici-repentis]KAI0577672.1 dna polymerase subunit cdc27 [Pyrenophora tritici-repentis]KAI0622374.1 dna polymerase subunit cdc27 [Pyrenophora tritici-repentis]